MFIIDTYLLLRMSRSSIVVIWNWYLHIPQMYVTTEAIIFGKSDYLVVQKISVLALIFQILL